MPGRKDYTREEIDGARSAIEEQLTAYPEPAGAAYRKPAG